MNQLIEMLENQIELMKEDMECIHMYLDDMLSPRKDASGKPYSVVGRIQRLLEESNYQPKIKELEEKVKSLEREQGIIGSLTLRLERAESVIERRSEMLRISKKEAGYSNDISFDDIWKEVLEKAQKYDQLANK